MGVMDTAGILGADRLPLSTSLGGVSVTVDGIAAPVLAVANTGGVEQVNFQVPFEAEGRPAASVVVSRDGAASIPTRVAVLELQPAVYTTDGTQAVVVHNADYTLVTAARPLVRGEYAFLYASGLGRVTNQPAAGAAAPVAPPASALADTGVTLAGLACEVQYGGLAPALAGVYQVNFRVPLNAPGGLQELTLTAGTATAPVVKVPVR